MCRQNASLPSVWRSTGHLCARESPRHALEPTRRGLPYGGRRGNREMQGAHFAGLGFPCRGCRGNPDMRSNPSARLVFLCRGCRANREMRSSPFARLGFPRRGCRANREMRSNPFARLGLPCTGCRANPDLRAGGFARLGLPYGGRWGNGDMRTAALRRDVRLKVCPTVSSRCRKGCSTAGVAYNEALRERTSLEETNADGRFRRPLYARCKRRV